ncbi:MAG: helix-turn-helix domain-containing protein [Eubacterium sp.]|nr:helix-turn-helix domain-containing protein [Eubacterium sp.]
MNTNELIKKRRKELRLTMKEVADAVGVSEATVSRWESGNIANMGRDKIALLSKVLKISPSLIAGYDENDIAQLSDDELDQQIIAVFNRLPEEKQKQALDYLAFLASQD